MLAILLAWPEKELWPNARAHPIIVAGVRKIARAEAYYLTRATLAGRQLAVPAGTPIELKLVFCPPHRRRFDLDNAQAAMKSALDGLAQALGIDDRWFRPQPLAGDMRPGGLVEVRIAAEVRSSSKEGSVELWNNSQSESS